MKQKHYSEIINKINIDMNCIRVQCRKSQISTDIYRRSTQKFFQIFLLMLNLIYNTFCCVNLSKNCHISASIPNYITVPFYMPRSSLWQEERWKTRDKDQYYLSMWEGLLYWEVILWVKLKAKRHLRSNHVFTEAVCYLPPANSSRYVATPDYYESLLVYRYQELAPFLI